MRLLRRHPPILLFLSFACAHDNPSPDGFTVTDSAGISIIENHSPEWTDDTAWQVGAEPRVRIGGSDDPEQQLYDVNAAIRLDDGRIVVSNAGSHQLKFFDPDGTWLFDRGGEGAGPGEFHDMTGFARFGEDSVVVFDRREKRRTVFSTEGNMGSIAPFGGDRIIFPGGVLGDGTIIGHVGYSINPAVEDQPERPSFALVRIDGDGSSPDTILILRGLEVYRHGGSPGVLPFARSTLTAARDSTIYTADTERYEIHRHDGLGSLEAVARKSHDLEPVQAEEVEAIREERLANYPPTMRELMGPAIEAAPAPPTMPALGELEVDAAGNLWVKEYRSPFDEGPIAWSVFNTEGRWLGDVEIPDGVTLYDIGDDYILGVERDELDVEYVVLYDLRKTT